MDAAEEPLVSVIMPVRNEARFVDRALRSVLSQDYPSEHVQVIVADGMSEDGTRDIVRTIGSRHANLQLIENPGRTAPTALNAALRAARGEIVVRVDGHCEIAPDYVRRCVAHLQSGVADGVGGPIETVGETPSARAVAIAMGSRFGVGNSAFRTRRGGNVLVDTVAFPAYRRSLIDAAGSFDEELVRNQDDEYNYRLRKLGARILLAEDVRARYYSRSSLRSLWRQYFQYGFWKVRVLQKHPRQMRMRQFVPPLFVAVMGALLALALFGLVGWAFLAVCAAIYCLAAVAAAFAATGAENRHLAPLVACAFPVLHVGYGLGFFAGIGRFWNRWGEAEPVPARQDARQAEVSPRTGEGV